jgi:hypothetical protein
MLHDEPYAYIPITLNLPYIFNFHCLIPPKYGIINPAKKDVIQ